MLTNAPRGTKDILPKAVLTWSYIEEKIRDICKAYGYEEIRTPIFEHTELFLRGIGDDTDVVDKEMYTFIDRGDRSLTLRPENTASVVRAYLQNKLYADDSVTKLFYTGSMFRYDRPQAGRMREFHQFGVEAIGSDNPLIDAEIIILAVKFLRSLGLEDLELTINSVGCPKCRPVYKDKLQEYFKVHLDNLCDDCNARYHRSPLRILDCKVEQDKEFMAKAPIIEECLCEECQSHYDKVKDYLTAGDINYKIDNRLVRGLDYYTKTAFEIKYPPLGAQSAVAGGGRYDGLVAELGGRNTPAVGFATGLERVILALEKQGLVPSSEDKADIFIIALGDNAILKSFPLLLKLREAKLKALMDYQGRSMKAQLRQADKSGANYVLIIGDDEVKKETAILRDMSSSQQEEIPLAKVLDKIFEVID